MSSQIVTDFWMKKPSIKIGDRFTRWTIIQKDPGWSRWLARCECGTEKVLQSGHLFAGQTKSCGCLRDELASSRTKKHGKHGTAEYRTWRGIQSRCHNSTDKSFLHYGGRGIFVCDRWRQSFENFFADMGDKPGPGFSIEREDNNKGYSPDNCRWATAKEQSHNRRSSQHVMLDGQRIIVAEAARRLDMHRGTIWGYAEKHDTSRQAAVDHYASRRQS